MVVWLNGQRLVSDAKYKRFAINHPLSESDVYASNHLQAYARRGLAPGYALFEGRHSCACRYRIILWSSHSCQSNLTGDRAALTGSIDR
jgi:hypothetical protein